MPTGPNGEQRPDDANACAVAVMKIATGQVEEKVHQYPTKDVAGREGFEPSDVRAEHRRRLKPVQ